MQRFLLAGSAILSSALLWRFGTGLHPLAGLAFLAPLPVLLLTPRVSAISAFLAGLLSWLGGELQLWTYLTVTLEQPVPVTVLLLGGTALMFGGILVVTRALLLRGRPGLAAVALPAGWVSVEFLLAVAGPFGAWWSIAYTQADVLPLIQTTSLTGVWGVTFLILLVPSAIAVLASPGVARAQRLRVVGATTTLLAVLGAFGCWRLVAAHETASVRVGLVAVAQPPDYVPVDSADGRDMVARVVAEIERLADRGAEVVVLPEKSWRADDSTIALLSGPLTEVAARRGIHVVAGLVQTTQGVSYNAAIAYPSGVRYAKHYLIPGLEDEHRPGTWWRDVPGKPWALAVCFDLDHPDLVLENRRRGATVLLVPALDFTDDRWLHSRMAVLRGVESGMGVARAPQLGELVASDARGRVLASAATDVTVTRSVLAEIPLTSDDTVYVRFGNWFGWVCVALFSIAAGAGAVRSRGR
ncbi:nitrilase-related carbon-nitrogen hydrolase [Nocardia tenerifensis]|uniref:nitrilase-related carbon-nitrogen hydrolase n=1 Tax=Nocardia tenerifensis TaxID=228006 RepID=UPI0012F6A578|nr:nitrilase-related carbon-nitrogen hydrolase [Nocardia tenerifensis]